jgi:phospholipid/cholesterol/gamma-HCH transport system permease protein
MSGLATTWFNTFRSNGEDMTLARHLQASPVYAPLSSASEMASVASRTLKSAFTSISWLGDAVAEASWMFRRTLVPVAIAASVYAISMATILLGNVVTALGASDRMPAGTYLGCARELITWLTMMILAGMAGSAVTGDIGARKIREELDALDVLGVDKFRLLVVPRVIALTFVGTVLPLITLVCTTVATTVAAIPQLHIPLAVQINALELAVTPYDLYSQCLKHAIIGFFIGVVACQKGLSSKGGAEGVGRAVNQSVVISFFGVWLINSLFNMAYMTLFRDALALKG